MMMMLSNGILYIIFPDSLKNISQKIEREACIILRKIVWWAIERKVEKQKWI